MRIQKDGLVMNTAYAFMPIGKRPTGSVNGCALLWRFLWCGLWRVVLNLLLIIIFVISALFTPIWRFVFFLCGFKMKYIESTPSSESPPEDSLNNTVMWEWIEEFPIFNEEFLFFFYTPRKNWGLPTLFGYRLVPGVVLLALALLGAEGLLIAHVWGAGLSAEAFQTDKAVRFFVIELAVFVAAAFIGLVAFIGFTFNKKTEIVQLVAANIRSFKEKTCPVVEIVKDEPLPDPS